jgi:hypothetical protein
MPASSAMASGRFQQLARKADVGDELTGQLPVDAL